MIMKDDFLCKPQGDGLAQDLKTYLSFINLSTSGKNRVLFVGDSMMGNFYESLVCGIQRSGIKTNKTGMVLYKWKDQKVQCESLPNQNCYCNAQPDSQGSLQRLDFELNGDLASVLF